MIEIRLFEARDAEPIAQLFHDSVRNVAIRDYTVAQVKAWAPDDIHFRDWATVCASRFTYVAEDVAEDVAADERVVAGFGELEANGHIDCFYCHHRYQRCGVGTKLYQAIEAKAVELSVRRLYTEASITAKPFFQRMGFSVVADQSVLCRGESLVNYKVEKKMEKRLSEIAQ